MSLNYYNYIIFYYIPTDKVGTRNDILFFKKATKIFFLKIRSVKQQLFRQKCSSIARDKCLKKDELLNSVWHQEREIQYLKAD